MSDRVHGIACKESVLVSVVSDVDSAKVWCLLKIAKSRWGKGFRERTRSDVVLQERKVRVLLPNFNNTHFYLM